MENFKKCNIKFSSKLDPRLKNWTKNVKKFNHKIIEVFHVQIGIQKLKLWNLEVEFWVPILIVVGTTEKSN